MRNQKVSQPTSYAKPSAGRRRLLDTLRTPGAAKAALHGALASDRQIHRLRELYTHGVFSHQERAAIHAAIDNKTLKASRAGFLIGDGKRRIAEFDAMCLEQQAAEEVTEDCVEAMAEEYAAGAAAKANWEAEALKEEDPRFTVGRPLFEEGAEDKAERQAAFDRQAAEFGQEQHAEETVRRFTTIDVPLVDGAEALWDCD